MAAEIPNLVKRNGIYYFRCRIPSNLTNGRAREVKISLKTGNLTSDLLDVILKVTDYSRRVIAETVKSQTRGGANDMNIVSEIRNKIVQYINTSKFQASPTSPKCLTLPERCNLLLNPVKFSAYKSRRPFSSFIL